jgi:hypothetical protein
MMLFLLVMYIVSCSQLIATRRTNPGPSPQEKLEATDGLVGTTEDLLGTGDGLMEAIEDLLETTLGEKMASYCTIISIG